MGFLDRAKKLADQAKDKAAQAKEIAQETVQQAKDRASQDNAGRGATSAGGQSQASGGGTPADPRMGTPYVSGMLGRPGWRERGLVDPAALLPIGERDRAGVPHSTKSQIIEEPFGMGRRWSSDRRSAALFYQLYPEHQAWVPPGGKAPLAEVTGASVATLVDGRSLVFVAHDDRSVVLEMSGLEDSARVELARAVAERLAPA